jgi:hypothetical protein
MVPVDGFFEYGIAALRGAAVMMVLAIWALVVNSTCAVDVFSSGTDEEVTIPDHHQQKEAA